MPARRLPLGTALLDEIVETPLDKMAEKYGVTKSAICVARNRAIKAGFRPSRIEKHYAQQGAKSKTQKIKAPKPEAPLPVVPSHPFWTPERDRIVWRSGGTWQGLRDAAEYLGKPYVAVQARWHTLRAA